MLHLLVPVSPIPAPRPRVSSKGWTYYPARYKEWRRTVTAEITRHLESLESFEPFLGAVEVTACFIVERPKKTKLAFPRGDLDNYEKALFDQMTKARVWEDDNQIVWLHTEKQWAEPNTPGCIKVTVTER